MSRKRNSNRKSDVPSLSIDECELEYYRPGCYCMPQVMPNNTPYKSAYLHDYVPQWTAACNTATYVVDTYGMVYYLSDFEHQMQFPNNMVETEIAYHIPTYVYEKDCDTAAEDDGGEAVSPRKRDRLENEYDVEEAEEAEEEASGNSQQESYHESSTPKFTVKAQAKTDGAEHGYYVQEPADIRNKVEQS